MVSTSDLLLEDKRLLARVDDAVRLCRKKKACFIGFLDMRQAVIVQKYLDGSKYSCTWKLNGGHDDAERVMLGVFDDESSAEYMDFPIEAVAFRFRVSESLTHRDVLGSLMGCQIAREKVGDILCAPGLAVVFIQRELAPFIVDQISKIGREGVTAEWPFEGVLPVAHDFESIGGTVASARIDSILKILLSCSREQAASYIKSMLVSIDHQPCSSVSCAVKEGQIISVKGKGRFIVDDLSDMTAKGRLIVRARRYV